MAAFQAEGEWLCSLGARDKVAFLAMLGHAITIAARETYVPQSSGVAKPEQLREMNEVQHRVLACLLDALSDKATVSFERSIAEMVLNHSDQELRLILAYAWSSAKNRQA
jgi:hypothetical protein